MLYLRERVVQDAPELIEYCKRCGYEHVPENGSSTGKETEVVVYEKSYEQGYVRPRVDEVAFTDPAVPTTREVACPNPECTSRKEGGPDAAAKFIVLNPDTYSILYRCVHCERVWKNKN